MSVNLQWECRNRPVKERRDDGTMRFGIGFPYAPTTVPSTAFADAPDPLDARLVMELAVAAEEAGFDFGFLADGYAPDSDEASSVRYDDPRPAATLWAIPAFLATKTLGFITTFHTTYIHPTHTARIGAQLDWISQGRWGWNVVTGFREREGQLFGFEQLPDHDDRYEMAEEAIAITHGLWNTAEGRFEFDGKYFSCHGRIAGPLPLQRPPLKVQAGVSERGKTFAATHCDYLFAPLFDLSEYGDIADEMAKRSEAAGRTDSRCVPLVPWLFHVRQDARQARDEFDAFIETMYRPAVDAGAKNWEKNSQSGGGGAARILRKEGVTATVGSIDEVAEQLIFAHREHGLRGMIAAMLFWGAESARTMGDVFSQLERAGAWIPPRERDFCW